MTDFLDSATISGKTTPSSSQIVADLDSFTISGITTPGALEEHSTYDSDTITSITSISYEEITTTERLVVTESDSGLAVGDTVSFVVSVTVTTTTTDGGTPPPSTDTIIGVTINTTDYVNDPWIVAYNYDSGAAVTSGTQATFDGDDGILPVNDAI